MFRPIATFASAAAGAVLAAIAFGQSAQEIRGASPYNPIENEAPPRVIADPPLPEPLTRGIVEIQYRLVNVHIVPVFGTAGLGVSPRIGHLHVTVDNLPWHWVVSSNEDNTIAVVGLPPGLHEISIEVVDARHRPFSACAECRQTLKFTVPGTDSHAH
ncbi:MAG: DUF6130 family protein [Capsulimonadaceae bacterium]